MKSSEKLYEELIALKNLCSEDEQRWIEQAVNRNERTGEAFAFWQKVANLIIDAREDIAEQSAKSTGKGNLFKYCQNLLKYNDKIEGRKALTFAKVFPDGYQYACDGYKAIKMKNALPLPACPAELGFPALDRILPNSLTGYEQLTSLPSVTGLKAYCKICRAENKNLMTGKQVVYRIAENTQLVNAKWFYEAMEVLPNAKVYYSARGINFLFIDEQTDTTILLLGVREGSLSNYEHTEVA